jgi:hypothetical protein
LGRDFNLNRVNFITDKRKIETAEVIFLRPMARHNISSEIRDQLGIFNTNDKLTQYKINWREHIQKMDDNRL